MPSPEQAYADAWDFDGIRVLDPYQLLRNKLGVNREKDRPHAEILDTFLRGHVLLRFGDRSLTPRQRLVAAQTYLAAITADALPNELFEKMAGAAETNVARRFLIDHAPSRDDARAIVGAAPSSRSVGLGGAIAAHRDEMGRRRLAELPQPSGLR